MTLLQSVTKSRESVAALQQALQQDAQGKSEHRSSSTMPWNAEDSGGPTMNDPAEDLVVLQSASHTVRGLREEEQPSSSSDADSEITEGPALDTSRHNNTNPLELADHELQDCLETFRTKMLPSCPFVRISTPVSVKSLKRDRPFLLQAIATVATPSTQKKIDRGRELHRILSQELVTENRSTIDLLLAVLTFVAWSYDQFLGKTGLSRLTSLAMSIVYDLALFNQDERDCNSLVRYPGFMKQDGAGQKVTDSLVPNEFMLERSRAVLGCFLMSSVVSYSFGKMEPLRWTPHLEDCLKKVEAHTDCHLDVTLALQVRLQLVVYKLHRTLRDQDLSAHSTILYLEALLEELRKLEGLIPRYLAQSDFLRVHCKYAEVCIANVASRLQPLMSTHDVVTSGLKKLEYLSQSLATVKVLFDIMLSITPSAWIGFSLPSSVQIGQCLATLFNLSTLDEPGWDCQATRRTCDLVAVLDGIIDIVSRASIEVGEIADDDLFNTMRGNMLKFREGFIWSTSKEKNPEGAGVSDVQMMGLPGSQLYHPFKPFSMLDYGFFGTGEWMESIFDGPF